MNISDVTGMNRMRREKAAKAKIEAEKKAQEEARKTTKHTKKND